MNRIEVEGDNVVSGFARFMGVLIVIVTILWRCV